MLADHLVYTIVVSNAGPSDVAGVSLSDTLPVELTGETFCEGAACDPSAGGGVDGFDLVGDHRGGRVEDGEDPGEGGSVDVGVGGARTRRV